MNISDRVKTFFWITSTIKRCGPIPLKEINRQWISCRFYKPNRLRKTKINVAKPAIRMICRAVSLQVWPWICLFWPFSLPNLQENGSRRHMAAGLAVQLQPGTGHKTRATGHGTRSPIGPLPDGRVPVRGVSWNGRQATRSFRREETRLSERRSREFRVSAWKTAGAGHGAHTPHRHPSIGTQPNNNKRTNHIEKKCIFADI